MLVMQSTHAFFEKVKRDFEHSLKDGALREAGVVDVRHLDLAEYGAYKSPSLLLYKPNYALERYDNNITYFDQINDFINLESLPLIIPLNAYYYSRVFGGSVNVMPSQYIYDSLNFTYCLMATKTTHSCWRSMREHPRTTKRMV